MVVDPSVAGVASAGKVAAVLRPLNRRLGLVVREAGAAVPVRARRRASSTSRWSPGCGTQRRLAEHVDLGLGPVHSRRAPLARAARVALDAHREARSVA